MWGLKNHFQVLFLFFEMLYEWWDAKHITRALEPCSRIWLGWSFVDIWRHDLNVKVIRSLVKVVQLCGLGLIGRYEQVSLLKSYIKSLHRYSGYGLDVAGVSNLRPPGHVLRIPMNAAQHKIVTLLKTILFLSTKLGVQWHSSQAPMFRWQRWAAMPTSWIPLQRHLRNNAKMLFTIKTCLLYPSIGKIFTSQHIKSQFLAHTMSNCERKKTIKLPEK